MDLANKGDKSGTLSDKSSAVLKRKNPVKNTIHYVIMILTFAIQEF